MAKQGFFLALEGPDGSGKTTISKKLCELLNKKSISYVLTREPGCDEIDVCKKIRKLILDDQSIDAKTEALLFAANRSEHVTKLIQPSIDDDKFIICDRYIDSSIAYQGFGRELGYKNILKINMFAINNLLPDLTIFINIKPEVGLDRIKKNRHEDINRLDNETLNFHQKVYDGYFKIIRKNKKRYVVIDGNQEIDKIFEQVIQAINVIMKKGNYFINEI